MSRPRLFIIGLLAITLLSAIGSASASAAACKTSKEKWVYCNAANEAIKQEKIEGTGGTTTIKTENISIQCASSTLKTRYFLGIPFTSHLVNTSCKVEKPSTCSVASTIEGELDGTLIGAVPGGPPEEELTGAGKGEEIATITIKGGSCLLAGTRILSGSQTCKFDPTYETSQETHEVVCTSAGSKLKFGGETATLERTIKDRLESKANWSVRLN